MDRRLFLTSAVAALALPAVAANAQTIEAYGSPEQAEAFLTDAGSPVSIVKLLFERLTQGNTLRELRHPSIYDDREFFNFYLKSITTPVLYDRIMTAKHPARILTLVATPPYDIVDQLITFNGENVDGNYDVEFIHTTTGDTTFNSVYTFIKDEYGRYKLAGIATTRSHILRATEVNWSMNDEVSHIAMTGRGPQDMKVQFATSWIDSGPFIPRQANVMDTRSPAEWQTVMFGLTQ